MKHSKKGFSLLELLVTLAIITLVALLGMPSFQGALRSSRLTSSINELSTALGAARSEAIKQNRSVTVLNKGTWSAGWTVFVDINGNGVMDGTSNGDSTDCAATNPPHDCILIDHEALPTGSILRSSSTIPSFIRYTPSGLLGNALAAKAYFYLCNPDSTNGTSPPAAGTSRVLIINLIGQTRMAVDSNNDGIPELTTTSPATNISTCTPA